MSANEMATITGEIIRPADLHENLQKVVNHIDDLVTEQHASNIMAMWRVGRLLTEIDNEPEHYLTPEQHAKHVSPSALLFHVFHKTYTPDQFNVSRQLYENYSTEEAIKALIEMRCPARPSWRVTASHVQLLLSVQDPEQRKVIEERCAQEAYTTKALSVELNEMRGEKTGTRSPSAPKGLKQRVHDLLEHQRKFISRSEKLWLEDEGLYDSLMNSSPTKITDTIRGYMEEVTANFEKLSDMVQTHQAMCQRFAAIMDAMENDEEERADSDGDPEADSDDAVDESFWHDKGKQEKRITR